MKNPFRRLSFFLRPGTTSNTKINDQSEHDYEILKITPLLASRRRRDERQRSHGILHRHRRCKRQLGSPPCIISGDGTITDSSGTILTGETEISAGDVVTFNAASGHLPGYDNGTFVADIVLGENAVTSDAHNGYALSIYRGASNVSQTFTGSVSGSGNLGFGDDSAANTSTYVFTGDLTGLQGNIVANYFTSGGLRFGENETAGAYSSSASAVDNVITNITGTGAISTKGSITYNYTGGAHGEALSVDNSSITAERPTFGGGAAYTLNSDVVAKSSFTLSSGSSLTVVAEKTLDLSGAVVTLASAI